MNIHSVHNYLTLLDAKRTVLSNKIQPAQITFKSLLNTINRYFRFSAIIYVLFIVGCSKNKDYVGKWSKIEQEKELTEDGIKVHDKQERILYFGSNERGYMKLPNGERWNFSWGSKNGQFYYSFDINPNIAYISLSDSGNQLFAESGGYGLEFGGTYKRVTDY